MNKKKKREYQKKYYEENKEKIKVGGKKYREENKEKMKKYYEENKEKMKKYYEENKEKIKVGGKKYREENKEKIKVGLKKYREENKEKIKVGLKKYREENKEKINRYVKNRRKQDSEFNIKLRLRNRFGSIFRNYIKTKKINSSKEYGIDYKKIIEHLKPFPASREDYHIDHIIPLASFKFIKEDNTLDFKQIKKAFEPENHQWLKSEDNLSKSAKIEKQKILISF